MTALPAPAPTWWHDRVGGLPRTFWVLLCGTLVNRLGAFVVPFLSLYLTGARGFTIARAGVVLTVIGVGGAVAQPVGGVLADRIGRRRTLLAGLVGAATGVVLVGAAHSFVALCVAGFAYGLVADVYRPAISAAIADVVDDARRPRAYALQFWVVNVGFAVATLLGGVLADRGYWLLFAGDALTTLLFAALVLRAVPETRPDRVPGATTGSVRQVLGDRLMLGLVLCTVLQATAYLQAFVTLPLVVVGDGLGTGGFGVVIALNGVLIVVLQPLLLGHLGRRAQGPLLLAGSLVLGAGLAMTVLADSLPGHLLVVAVWTVGEVLGAGVLSAVVARLAPADLRGRYMGVFGMSWGVSAVLAPAMGTLVLQHLGEGPLWAGCLALCVVAGTGLMLVAVAAGHRTPTPSP